MQFEYSPYAVPYLVAFVVNIFLLWVLWQYRDRRGASGFILFCFAQTILSPVVALQILSTDIDLKIFLWSLQVTPLSMAAIGGLAVGIEYTNRESLLTPRTVAVLCIVPVLTQLFALVDNGSLFATYEIDPATGLLAPSFGPLYLFWAGLQWLYLTVAYVLFLALLISRPNFKWQSSLLVGTGLFSFAGWVLWVVDIIPVDPLALTSTFALVLISVAVGRFQLLDVVPVARQTAWNEMENAVVTLDEADRVIDSNRTARALFGVEGDPGGMSAAEFFSPVPDSIIEQFRDVSSRETEVSFELDGQQRWFSVSISPVEENKGSHHARVVTIEEITSLKRREAELEAREQELDVLRQVQSRVLRHNIRTELSMVRGHAQLVASEVDGENQQRMECIIDAGERLATISDKARVIEELFDDEQSPREYDIRRSIDEAVENIRQEHPELAISVTGADHCEVTASPYLQTAVENLLENAAAYNDSDTPQADVHLVNGSEKRITVSDNGPGIPDQELSVLDKESEEALEHGSGLGLWLVKWIVDRSDGELRFDTSADGTDVTITFGA